MRLVVLAGLLSLGGGVEGQIGSTWGGAGGAYIREETMEPPLWTQGQAWTWSPLNLGYTDNYIHFRRPPQAFTRLRLFLRSPGLGHWLYRELGAGALSGCPQQPFGYVGQEVCLSLPSLLPEAQNQPLRVWLQAQWMGQPGWYNLGSVHISPMVAYGASANLLSANALQRAYQSWRWWNGQSYAQPFYGNSYNGNFYNNGAFGNGGRVLLSRTLVQPRPQRPVYYQRQRPGVVERYRSSRRVDHLPAGPDFVRSRSEPAAYPVKK